MRFDSIDRGSSFDFGKTADEYAKFRDIYPKRLYDRLYELGVGHSGESWLDLGTGTGVLPKNMYRCTTDITGVDISEQQIAQAKAIAEREGMSIRYIVSAAENTGFPDSSFDSITAAQCFWYFDRDSVLAEIKRLLKPGGLFVKIYMTYTLDDETALMSHQLVQRLNPLWTPGATGVRDMHDECMPQMRFEEFVCELPFTRESWHGRMLACRGTMASMDAETLAEWESAHKEALLNNPAQFTVKHKIYITSFRNIGGSKQ